MRQTGRELFRRLEEQGIRYAVMRNYEPYPALRDPGYERNTDVDQVVDSGDIPISGKLLFHWPR